MTAEIKNISMEDYHASKNSISKSMLSVLADCAAKFKHRYIDGVVPPEKDFMNVGSAVHTLALEPDLFHSNFYIIPEGIRRDKRTKDFQSCIAEANGRKMITFKDHESVSAMARALAKDKKARALLDAPGRIEASIFWEDKETGISLRCRPDFLREDGLIVDLKTSHSAKPDLFYRTAWDKCYDVSAAMTCDAYEALTGKPPQNYVFLVIEGDDPHICEAYDSFTQAGFGDLTYVEGGRARFRKLLERYKYCVQNNFWPSYNSKIMPMGFPYAAKQFLDTGEL